MKVMFLSIIIFSISLYGQTEEEKKQNDLMLHFDKYTEALNIKDYDTALSEALMTLELAKEVFPENDPTITTFYINLSDLYVLRNEYENAISNQKVVLSINIKIFGETHLDVANSYINIAKLYQSQKKHLLAFENFNKSLSIKKQILGDNHSDIIKIYNYLANIFDEKGDYNKSVDYYKKIISIISKTSGEYDSSAAIYYNNLGSAYYNQGDYDNSINSHLKSISIKLKSLKENHPDIAISYQNIAVVYNSKGNYDKAMEYYKKSFKINKANYEENHPSIASVYHGIGLVYQSKGEFKRALKNYIKSLSIRLNTLGEKHPDISSSYNNIGSIYRRMGDYSKAIIYYKKTLDLDIYNFGEDHPYHATTLNNLGNAYKVKGDYNKAIEYLEKALEIDLKTIGENHSNTAFTFINLGQVYHGNGNYNKAIDYYEKSLSIRIKTIGENHTDTASSYNSLGNVYYSIGEFKKSIEYTNKALSIGLKIFGKYHNQVASSFNQLGLIYISLKDYTRAIEYMKKSLLIRLKVLGEKHLDTAVSYNNLCFCYRSLPGQSDKAIDYCKKALKIYKINLEENHPLIATLYINLGFIYKNRKNYENAIYFLKKAIKILEVIPEEKYLRFIAFQYLSDTYEELNIMSKQISILEEAISLIPNYRLELGNDKDYFTETQKPLFDKLFKHYLKNNQIEQAFQLSEKMRGLSILENFNLKYALKEGKIKDPEKNKILDIQEKLEGMYSQRSAIKRNLLHNKNIVQEKYADELWNKIILLQNEEKSLEKKISNENPKFRELRKIKIPKLLEFQWKFGKEKKTYIEYLFTKNNEGKESLSAFVINEKESIIIKLGENLDLERRIGNLREIISSDPSERNFIVVKRNSGKEYIFKDQEKCNIIQDAEKKIVNLQVEKLYIERKTEDELVCKPIKQLSEEESNRLMNKLLREIYSIIIQPIIDSNMIGTNSITISPDKSLFTIPFAALIDKNNKYLSETYQVSLIPSAVIWNKLKRDKKEEYKYKIFAVGNPIYSEGHADSSGSYNTSKSTKKGFDEIKKKLTRSVGATTTFDEIEKEMVNLPGSISEMEEINKVAYEEKELSNKHFYHGIRANKDELFQKFDINKENKDYRIVHFSAHGLFFGDAPELNSLALTSRSNAIAHREKLLLEYEKQIGKQMTSDGFLKLGETIDLGLECELVVMSACETSLGTLRAGEGLVGLPQGFLMGGANYVMATLWSVDDAGTMKFMKDFYTKVFDKKNEKTPIPALLQETQKELSDKLKNKYYNDPFYWAPFIVYGR